MRKPGSVFAVAAVAAALSACGQSQSGQDASNSQAAASAASGTSAATQPAMGEAEKKALLASYAAPYNQADLANGEAKFGLCRSCHTITPGGANMTGPNLHGVFGQKAASKPNYNYSDAIKQANITWDAQHLDQWLADPKGYLPGTKMTFAGLKDANDRRDLIGYLMVETGFKP
ncbi:cytochrome c family protein [Phenylobacterium sp.]|jgi:cytochrome c|uniref:c-type cytochrome n=1 Tax=Phenylobacterium sp. TaxID=1871053 RepID=UPI002F925B94